MEKKVRIKKSELEELVDVFEGSYLFEQPRPAEVDIEDNRIHVRFDTVHRVAPLTQSDFFTSFAKLAAHGDPSKAKIKRWVGRFGLPLRGWRPEPADVAPEDTKPDFKILYKPKYKAKSMEVEAFRSKARYARDLLHLYSLVRGRDAPAIKDKVRKIDSTSEDERSELDMLFRKKYKDNMGSLILSEAGDNRLDSYGKPLPVSKRAPDAVTEMAGYLGFPVDGDATPTMRSNLEFVSKITVLAAQSALGEIVTGLVSDVRLRVGIQRGQGLAPSYQCADLASAIYLQFYLLVTKNKAPRFCENPPCGELFFPTNSKQIYCNNSCRSNARNYPNA